MSSRTETIDEPAARKAAAADDAGARTEAVTTAAVPGARLLNAPVPGASAPDAPALTWSVHPAAAQPARAVAVLAAIALAAALTFSVSGSAGLALLAGLMLLGSLRAWFLPRTYVLDAEGAAEQGPLQAARRIAWSEVRSVSRERHGIHVSPLQHSSRWVRERGLFLRTDGDAGQAGRVTAFIRQQRDA